MKKSFQLILILFISAGTLFSQKNEVIKNLPKYDRKLLHFGFTVGLSTADFSIRNSDTFFEDLQIGDVYSIENKRQPGFQLGPISNLRLGEYFDLRLLINLTFSQRDLTYKILKEINEDNDYVFENTIMKLSSTFIEFPLLIKYKAARIDNYRPYVVGGLNTKLDLASKKKIPEGEIKIRLSRPDLYYEIGFGVDFYTTYFKFAPEIKFAAGLFDIAVPDGTPYTGSMKYLKSNIIMLSFHFE